MGLRPNNRGVDGAIVHQLASSVWTILTGLSDKLGASQGHLGWSLGSRDQTFSTLILTSRCKEPLA